MKYLQIASNANLNRNANTIKAHNTFQKDFIANIEMISSIFDCAIEINDDFIITNYYQFLYDIISDVYFNAYQYRGYTGEVERKDNIWFDQDQHLFYHKSPGCHGLGSWYLTDSSLAIFVCDKLNSFIEKRPFEMRQRLILLNLEIGAFIAAGLTTVLICQFDSETTNFAKYLIEITIKDHLFSEIHFNLEFSSSTHEKEKYEEVLSSLLQIAYSIN